MLCARDPPTESEKDPRVEASLLAAPLKKLFGLVSAVVPGVRVASWTKLRPFKGSSSHLLGGNHLSQRGIRRFHGHLGGVYFNRRRNGSRAQA